MGGAVVPSGHAWPMSNLSIDYRNRGNRAITVNQNLVESMDPDDLGVMLSLALLLKEAAWSWPATA